MQRRQSDSHKKGYITLLSVIILTSMASLIVAGGLLTNIDKIDIVNSVEGSKIAKLSAESCAEIAINNLKSNLNYTGNENISFENSDCSIGTISGSGNQDRSFEVSGTYLNTIKRFLIQIENINPTTDITSWREI